MGYGSQSLAGAEEAVVRMPGGVESPGGVGATAGIFTTAHLTRRLSPAG